MFKYGTTSGKSMTGKSKRFMVTVYEFGRPVYQFIANDKNSMNKTIEVIKGVAERVGSEVVFEKRKVYPSKYVGYMSKVESCRLGQK